MDSQVQNDAGIPYGRVPLPEKSNVSSLNQALGSHLATQAGARSYADTASTYRGLPSSPTNPQSNGQPQQSPSMVNFSSVPPSALKRKPDPVPGPVSKRKHEGDEESFDGEGGAQGAKHWTDEEKTKLFEWLMAPNQDDHWNALRATKNSCLRECAAKVFDNKKTYQALKGCYERNFNLFKQIYAFEMFNAQAGNPDVGGLTEADRLRQYDQRLQTAKRAGCDVGNITARTVDAWHRNGWYNLFCARWHGDPATTRPSAHQQPIPAPSSSRTGAGEHLEIEDESTVDLSDLPAMKGILGLSPNHATPRSLPLPSTTSIPATSQTSSTQAAPSSSQQSTNSTPTSQSSSQEANVNITVPQSLFTTYLQLLQTQTQTAKLKLEFLRRKEEQDRESSKVKHRTQLATELLANPGVDMGLKETAVNYLKGLFKD